MSNILFDSKVIDKIQTVCYFMFVCVHCINFFSNQYISRMKCNHIHIFGSIEVKQKRQANFANYWNGIWFVFDETAIVVGLLVIVKGKYRVWNEYHNRE